MKKFSLLKTALSGEQSIWEVSWFDVDDIPLDPDYMEYHWTSIRERMDFLYGTFRPRICLVCGKPFGNDVHLHHCIVTRGDIRGWKRERRILIDTEINLIPLHPTCHLNSPPTREDAWEYQCAFYGGNIVNLWYNGLEWKGGKPRKFWEEDVWRRQPSRFWPW